MVDLDDEPGNGRFDPANEPGMVEQADDGTDVDDCHPRPSEAQTMQKSAGASGGMVVGR